MTSESFRVDLRGVVDILSHHLYSSPRVYLRELVQNARDAVVARRRLEPGAPEDVVVTVEPGTGAVVVRDRGIGLSEDEMRTVLATIGASSKRDDLLRARDRYLGQFGIGLLSCFLVADRIEVTSRSAREPDAPTLRWVGSADGTFTVGPADAPLAEPGTVVRLVARPDEREWTSPARVRLLLVRFAALLDLPVHLEDGEAGWGAELVSRRTPPWRASAADLAEWCRAEMGSAPLAALPISVPAAGVVGLALVVDSPGRVGVRRGDLVFSHGMYVADDNTQLAPPWAYFVRLVVEAGDLPLTASRESLQHTGAVEEVAEQVGVQVREGIERFARRDPATFARFMEVHDKGLLAMAASDPDMLDLVVTHKRWETSEGPMTLAEAVRTRDTVRWTASRADFATFAPVLRVQGTLLVNGSYVYGSEILDRVGSAPTRPHRLRRFDPDRFLRELGEPDGDDEVARLLPGLAGPVLQRLGVALELRRFAPATVPVLYVAPPPRGFTDAATDGTAADGPDDPWADFAGGFTQDDGGPRLVANAASGAVRALVDIADERVRDEAVTGLLLIGRLSAGEKLDERDTALLGETLTTLVVAAGAGAPGEAALRMRGRGQPRSG